MVEYYRLFKDWVIHQRNVCSRNVDFSKLDDVTREFNTVCKVNRLDPKLTEDDLKSFHEAMNFSFKEKH